MFQVPKSTRTDADRFKFSGPNGEDCSLPLLKYAPLEAAAAFERGQESVGTLLCCDNAVTRTVVENLDSEQLGSLTDAWISASKVSPGESPASNGS